MPEPTSTTFPCRSCGSARTTLVLDLGAVPASDSFPELSDPAGDERFPLELYRCQDCTLLQLGPAAALPEEPPLAVDSATATRHARESVADLIAREGIRPGATLCEVDSGHGSSWRTAFLDAGLVQAGDDRPADVVVDLHYLMHEERLDDVLSRHRARLAPGGVLICEFYSGQPLVEKRLVDTIRHGHFLYLTLTSLLPALRRHGLTVTRVAQVAMYGGSLQVLARASSEEPHVDESVARVLAAEQAGGSTTADGVAAFAEAARTVAQRFRSRLVELAAAGVSVAGYGAPSKAAVLLCLAGIDRALLPFTVDLSPAKAGHRIPAAGVPIRPVAALLEARPAVVAVLTWDIAAEIDAQLAQLADGTGWRPTLLVPLPEPREWALGQY